MGLLFLFRERYWDFFSGFVVLLREKMEGWRKE